MLVNLYSDTQTRPSEAMRAAIASAEVGDEQRESKWSGLVAATMPPSWRSPRRDSRERGATSGARSTRSPLRA